MENPKIEGPLKELIINYNELNSSVIEELNEEPSALEFMRFVARNTPFVVRGGAADWQATRTWTVDYLKDSLRDEYVNVAVTPAGNADAPTPYTSPDDGSTSLVFAKPHEEDQPFTTFLSYLISQEHHQHNPPTSSQTTNTTTITTTPPPPTTTTPPPEIRYAQTQNDNLRHEYRPLFADVPATVPWARIALARDPDAVNLWIGNARSVTALHRDNYENIYVQIAGRKHFVLLPPACHAAVNETRLRPAVYRRRRTDANGGGGGGLEGREAGKGGGLELVLEEGGGEEEVPFAIWDPDRPGENATRYSALVQPMRVTLEPGDMLYLPCMWCVGCVAGHVGTRGIGADASTGTTRFRRAARLKECVSPSTTGESPTPPFTPLMLTGGGTIWTSLGRCIH
ncbi:Clavaminate synthase-like protein [Parathielavia hyrcaniae]|uniref:Clavaminate synthase-like protein n=1 Tax=Parathielavia hyrcaniae TaxID=113614 RepID=A0AAN6T4N4_9PEZI|nr:Clavaminate synthase-like protein [Parathielavia hyrcaniae]